MFADSCPHCKERVPVLSKLADFVKLLRECESDRFLDRCCRGAYAFAAEELAILLGETAQIH